VRFVDFSLSPIEEIQPWGDPGRQSLSWFGFSLGLYRLKFGEHLLLNYSDAVMSRWAHDYPDAYTGSYVDYQVVRLWEDLLQLLPHVLRPVPPALGEAMALSEREWRLMGPERRPVEQGSLRQNAVDVVGLWRDQHFLDSGYLSPSAAISFWLVDDRITVRWENQEKMVGDDPAWSASEGTFSLPRVEFISGVQAFNDEFMQAMGGRVNRICANWNRPEVRVDLAGLRQEQSDRSQWLARALGRSPADDCVSDVVRAFEVLKSPHQ
jgi:hypothetical protein